MSALDTPSDWTAEQTRDYMAFYSSRPIKIREMMNKWPLWKEWRLAATGKDYYIIIAYSERGTVRAIRHDYRNGNPVAHIFDMKPEEFIPR